VDPRPAPWPPVVALPRMRARR